MQLRSASQGSQSNSCFFRRRAVFMYLEMKLMIIQLNWLQLQTEGVNSSDWNDGKVTGKSKLKPLGEKFRCEPLNFLPFLFAIVRWIVFFSQWNTANYSLTLIGGIVLSKQLFFLDKFKISSEQGCRPWDHSIRSSLLELPNKSFDLSVQFIEIPNERRSCCPIPWWFTSFVSRKVLHSPRCQGLC